MKYIDMHCDTLMDFAKSDDYNIYSNDKMIDFLKLQKGECAVQFFAMFMPPTQYMKRDEKTLTDDEYIDYLSKGFYNSLKEHNDIIAFAANYDDIIKNEKENKISAILTIEDGRSVNNNFERLKSFYDLGVRLISLTWNFENCFGFPNSTEPQIMNQPLKDFGKEAVEVMNDMGIIIDVSHLSDGGFYDVATLTKKPFVASHSDCRSIANHPRNLTDDMIKILADKGGVSGINFYADFLISDKDERENKSHALIDDMIIHIDHFVNCGGIDCVALGSDFDGIETTVEIKDASMMQNLFYKLSKHGYSDDAIEKIAYKNALRVIKDTMK